MSQYDDLLNAPDTAAPDVAQSDNEYLNMLDESERQQKRAMTGQLSTAVKVNPDQYSTQRRVASYLGYPVAAVEANPQLKEQAQVQQVQQDTATRPVLQRKYTDADFAKLAHDDSGSLAALADFFVASAKYITSSPDKPQDKTLMGDIAAGARRADAGAAGLFRAVSEFLAVPLDFMEADTPQQAAGWRGSVGGNPLRRLAEGFGMIGAYDERRAKELSPDSGNLVADSISSGVQSLTQNTLLLPLALLPGGEPAVLYGMAGTTGGQSYEKAREAGVGQWTALGYGASDAVIEYATEKIPLGKLIGDLKANSSITKMLAHQIATEIPGEQVATIFQDLNEWAVLHPEQTFGDYLRERPNAAAQTLIATLIGVGGNVAVTHTLARVAQQADGSARAEDAATAFGDLTKLVEATKLAERSPEEMRSLLHELSGEANVRIDAATLMEAFNQSQLDIGQVFPTLNQEELKLAAVSGGEVSVPVADMITNTRGTPLEGSLVEHLRFGDNELSAAEAKQVREQLKDKFKKDFEESLAGANDAEAIRQSAENVRQTLLEQLNTAGRYRAQVNEAMSHWAAAFYSTMSQRLGMTPEEMYARYPLRVTGEATGQGSTLNDSGNRPGALTVEGYHYSKAQRQVLSGGAYGTGLKGSGYETYANAADKRLAKRVYFYADKGTGINPEAGVGGHAHKATLTNVYDANTDPLRLRKGSQTDFESALLDAGYSGYLDRLSGTQSAQVIMLGDQSIKPEYMGQLTKTTGAVVPAEGKRASLGRDQVVDAINDNKNLPSGSPARARWSQLLEKVSPAEHAALKAAGVFDGNQDEALFKSELVKEFERKTEAPVYEQGQEGPRVNFEVAPDPNNAELTDKWRALPEDVKQAVSERVAAEIVPKVLKAAGATGEITAQVGSYLDDTNPSFALKVTKGDPDIVAKALGYALSQDSMMTLAPSNFSGAEKVGAIHIAIGDKTAAEVAQIYKTLRAIEVDGENPIGGQSTSGGRMVVLNYSNVDTPALAELIDTALEGAYDVAHGDVFAAFPEKKDYDYADSKADPEGNEGLARQGARDARQEAAKLIDEAVENPEQFVKKEGHQEALNQLANNASGFERWAGSADVVQLGEAHDYTSGSPVVVAALHGTTGDFDTFSREMANPESDLGAGFYASNTPEDVGTNYAGEGPDLTNKLTLTAERIASDTDREYDDPEVMREARDALRVQHGGAAMPVWVKFDNPVVLGGNETVLSYEEKYNEETDEYDEPTGTLVDFVEALRDVARDYDGVDVEQTIAAIFEKAEGDSISASDLIKTIKTNEGTMYATDDEGRIVSTEIARRAFQEAGYDGFIDQTVSDKFQMSGTDADTVHFIAFEPNQIKSRIGNNGEFDPTNPSILGQGPRGSFNPKSLELVLSPTADLSTWFHESGHFYLEVLADIAGQPNAPAQIADDVNKILAWFGVKDLATWQAMSLDEKRRYHERFAESIEQYVMEGKAPSTELQPFFRRFRAWLMSVYKSLQSFLASKPDSAQTPLNDDIRRVMDRMLATDEQIQQANEIAGMVPDETADAEAAERLQRRSMADLKWAVTARDKVIKKLRREAKSIEKDIRAKVTEEVNQMPEVLAKQALDKAQAEHDASPVAADMNTATIADAFGYPSTDAMYKAIERFGNKQDVIDALTERRMLEDHGDLVDDRAIEAAANEAVHNEARARSLATELRTQREMLNPRQDTGRVASNGAKVTVNALVEAAKQFGNNVADSTVLKDLKAKVWQHTQAERRAARAWQEATAGGKTEEAVKAKQDQLLNNAAAKAVIDAKNEAAKTFEFFKRVVKGNDEKVVDKGRDPDIVNAARAVLAAYGVETATTKAAAEYLETVSKNDPETYNTIRPMVEGALQMAQPLESLTVEQLRSLHEEIQSLWFLAKRSRQMEVDGDLMDIEDAATQLHERMEKIGIPDKVPGEESALTDADKRKRWLQFAGALLRRVEQWSEKMDGKFGGPFLRLVFQPVKDAAERYRSDRVAYRKAFTDLVDKVAPSFTHKLIEAPELGYTFGKGHNGIGHAELMHAILHTGNESNLRKLLLGRNWGELTPDGKLDTTRWSAFITRLAKEGVLTREHFDFAQGVWDLLEKTKPQAQKAHRDVFGRYFNEVTATPFVDPFGVERAGGYLPAQADPMLVNDADLRSLAEIENENMAFAFPATNKGFTKSRVEYNRPLKLDLRTIPQHLDKVLLFSHMEPAVRGVAKLLRNKGVSQALNRIDPSAYSGMLLPWLNRSARQMVETPIAGDGGASRLLSTLRSRAGAALMFANISNSVQQLTGFLSAGVKVDSGHMMRAAAQMVAHPKQMIEAVKAQSEFMRNRMEGEIAHMTDLVNDIVLNHSLYQKAQAWSLRNTYFLQQAIDNTTGPIIWTAAYNQGLADGLSEKEAVRFADGTIRQTQQATSPEDVSRIETGPAYARIFTQFAGYFNMLANTNATALQQIASEMGLKKGAGKALGVVFFGVLAPIWVAEAIAQAFKGGPDDKDHDGYLDDWLAAVFGMGTIKGLLAYVPFVGQLANAGINKFNSNPNDDRVSLSPTVGLLESSVGVPADVYNAINGKLNAKKAIEDVASLVNVVTGLPTRALARPVGYLAGVEQDKIQPTSAADAVRGVATGAASPASRQR